MRSNRKRCFHPIERPENRADLAPVARKRPVNEGAQHPSGTVKLRRRRRRPRKEEAAPATGLTRVRALSSLALGPDTARARLFRVSVLAVVFCLAAKPVGAFCQMIMQQYHKANAVTVGARPAAAAPAASIAQAGASRPGMAAPREFGTSAAAAGSSLQALATRAAWNPQHEYVSPNSNFRGNSTSARVGGNGSLIPNSRPQYAASAARSTLPAPHASGQSLYIDVDDNNSPYSVTSNDTYASVRVGDGDSGELDQSAGLFKVSGTANTQGLYVAYGGGSEGTYNLSGTGNLTSNNLAEVGYGGTGTFNQTGGTASYGGTGLRIGDQDGSGGGYYQSDGSVAVTGTQFDMAENGGSTGFYVLSGSASLQTNNAIIGNNGGASFTQNGGSFSVNSGSSLAIAQGGDSTGNYYLNGGTLTTPTVAGGNGASAFYFNGGTLQAAADDYSVNSQLFFGGLTHAYVAEGGAIVDTNGFDVTISSVLEHFETPVTDSRGGTANGGHFTNDEEIDGGLSKQGDGTLSLTANNTYNGGTVVQAGGLFVNNTPVNAGDSGTGTGSVTVLTGAWLGGSGTIAGNVTVGVLANIDGRSPGMPRIVADMGTLTPGYYGEYSTAVLTINGDLTFTESGRLETELGGAAAGDYDQVVIGGQLSLDGTFSLSLINGFEPTLGEKFFILDDVGMTLTIGTFAGIPDGSLVTDSDGNNYIINYNDHDPDDTSNLLPNDVSLTFLGTNTSIPEPSTWALCGIGAALLGLVVRRQRRQA